MKNTDLLEKEIWLPAAREDVFKFFKDAENLQAITPPWLDFRIVTPLPIEMQQGTFIDYELKLYGLRIDWKTEITVWEPPFRFVDTQIEGPYRLWAHTHTFEEHNGGTWMQDRVEYLTPGGILSPFIDRLFVKPRLERIFEYRRVQVLKQFRASPENVSG
ncbi:SRPBCC family protein [candidate division KSB1 bacterium]|nr:SRPBCC family protein [candidate division KSB1 bacterium]NIR71766.1 SRPBCC family protein [candidate division KSB1 bacterium]NIS24922.1 SRPBCC family protein [candidate division KSB1 bacterium]NIT71798.1 SRPBCC family protein [candidate division KSB1 bacterium]NIU25536.1 SRPBCC family protein [candidate division KSB1 bacterium]